MAVCAQTIGKSAIQALFVEIEDVSGVLQKPTAGGFVMPAGDATLTQTPTFEASLEKSKSLNTTAQFQNAVEAGSATIPMYMRPAPEYGKPQGDALFQAMMGEVQESGAVTCSLVQDITADAVEMKVDTVDGGFLCHRGVLMVGSEHIRYTSRIEDATISGQYTLKGLVRGFGGTNKASHAADDEIFILSRVYLQNICRPTVSVWLQLDHTTMFMSGCSVSNTEIPLSNTGGQMMTFTMAGRRMGWCGQGVVASTSGAVVTLGEEGHFAYSEGGYIKNDTKGDDNTGAGYQIIAVDAVNNTITLNASPIGWTADDVLKPHLPVGVAVGDPTESRKVRIFSGDAMGTIKPYRQREGSLTIGTPTEFAQEIGDEYPGESSDSMREITVSGGLYFRAENAVSIGKGYEGYEERMDILLDDRAEKGIVFCLPRVKFNTPEPSVDGLFLVLTQNGTALGNLNEREGESSLYVVME